VSKFYKFQSTWTPYFEYFDNPWSNYKKFISYLKNKNANFITYSDVIENGYKKKEINIILDHHIDYYPIETMIMADFEFKQKIKSSIYLFNEFNYPDIAQINWNLSDLDINFYKKLEKHGFEIGYHMNVVGLDNSIHNKDNIRSYSSNIDINNERLDKFFARDISSLKSNFNIRTLIPHGGGEGNHQYTNWQNKKEYTDIRWVYNGIKRKDDDPFKKWKNFSDSIGTNAHVYKFEGSSSYIVYRDHLMNKAYTAKRGLHHILVHAGRMGKGMPYNKYKKYILPGSKVIKSVNYHKKFSTRKFDLNNYSLEKTKNQKNYIDLLKKIKPNYILTNSEDFIVSSLFVNSIIPIYFHEKIISREEIKELYGVKRPIVKHIINPKKLNLEELKRFYNHYYSNNVMSIFENADIPITLLCLEYKNKELSELISLIEQCKVNSVSFIIYNSIDTSFMGYKALFKFRQLRIQLRKLGIDIDEIKLVKNKYFLKKIY